MSATDDTDWQGSNADWSDVSGWSNGIPDTAGAAAFLGGTGTYGVTIASGESYAIAAVTISDYSASLLVEGTLQSGAGLNIEAGTLINAGQIGGPVTLSGGTLIGAGGMLQSLPSGTDFQMSSGELLFEDLSGAAVTVTNQAGAVLTASGFIGDVYTYNSASLLTTVSSVTLANAGTILAAASGYTNLDIDTDKLINTGLIGVFGIDNVLNIEAADFTNAATGTVSADGGYLYLDQGFVNRGLITVSGGELVLGGFGVAQSWSNQGVISASGALVEIGGEETLADLQSLQLANDTVDLVGIVENAGGSLGANAGMLHGATLDGGTIFGGVIDLPALGLDPLYGVLDAATLIDTPNLDITGGDLSLAGGTKIYADAGTALATVTVNGGVLEIDAAPGAVLDQPVLVQSGELILDGGFTLGAGITATGAGATIAINPYAFASFVNAGMIMVADGATLILGGALGEAGLAAGISLDAGHLVLVGTVENAGHTLNAGSGILSGATLGSGGTIAGGVLDAGALGLDFGGYAYAPGALDGVSLINGLTLDQGAVILEDGSTVYADAGAAAGTILVQGTAALTIDAAGTLDQPLSVTGGIAALNGSFTLAGNISASGAGSTLALDANMAGSFVNLASISATGGAALILGGDETAAALGHIDVTGGTLVLAGTLDNQGGTLDAASGALVGATLGYGGTICGGTLDAGALALGFGQYAYAVGGTLEDVTLINGLTVDSGAVTLAGGTQVFAGNTAAMPGDIVIGSTASITFDGLADPVLNNSITLQGGEISFTTLATTLGTGGVIAGFGDIYGTNYGTAATSLVNFGTIEAMPGNYAGQALQIEVESFVNEGLITAASAAVLGLGVLYSGYESNNAGTILSNGGQLLLGGSFVNTGLISLTGGLLGIGYTSYENYAGDTLTNLGTIAVSNGTVQLGGSQSLATLGHVTLTGSTLFLDGLLDAGGLMLDGGGASALLAGATLQNGTIRGGTLDVASLGLALADGELDGVEIIEGLTLDSGNITLSGGSAVYADAGTVLGTVMVDAAQYYTQYLEIQTTSASTIDQPIDLISGNVFLEGPFTLAGGVTASGADAYLTLGGAAYASESQSRWVNLSTITAMSGASVLLFGDERAADLGTIEDAGATIEIEATLENTGQTLDAANSVLTGATLSFGTIIGGVMDEAVLGLVFGAGAWLDDVTLINGLTVTSGELGLMGSTVYADAGTMPGTILVDASLGSAATLGISVASAGLIDQPVLVEAGEAILEGPFTLVSGLTAAGTGAIAALSGASSYGATPSSWVNLGIVIAEAGGTVLLSGNETAGALGTISNDGGTVVLAGGTFFDAGAVLGAASADLYGAVLDGGTIEGGTLDQAASGLVVGNQYYTGFYGQSDLDNVAILGDLTVAGELYLTGDTGFIPGASGARAGVLTVASGGFVTEYGAGNGTLSGQIALQGGDIEFQSASYGAFIETIAPAGQIIGYGYIEGASLRNEGLIAANVTNQVLALSFQSLVNDGTVIAQNGGIINDDLYANTITGGTFEVLAGSVLNFEYDTTFSGTLLIAGSGADAVEYNGLDVAGSIALAGGTLDVRPDYYYSASTLSLAPGGSIGGYGLIGSTTLDDEGVIAAQSGLLALSGSVTGGGVLLVAPLATLALGAYTGTNIEMLGAGGVVSLAATASLAGVIESFGAGDQLVVGGFEATGAFFSAGELTLANDTGSLTLGLAGSFAADAFAAAIDTQGDTVVQLGTAGTIVSLAVPGSLFTNGGIVTPVQGVSVSDTADSQITLQVFAQHGVLSANPVSGAAVQGGGTAELILSGSIAAVNAELATLVYRAPANGQGSDEIEVFAIGDAGDAGALIPVGINQPPSFALPAALFLEPGAPGSAAGVVLEKADAQPGEIFTVTASDEFSTLTGSAAPGGALYGSGGALVTFTGSLDAINAELAALTITGSEDDVLTLTAADGLGGSVAAGVAIDLNLPPVINGPASFVATLDIPQNQLGISITDPYAEAAGEVLAVTLAAGSGALAGGAQSGGTITLSGTTQQLNNALGALAYTASEQGGVLDPIAITAIDQHGGTSTATIEAIDIGQPPSFVVPGEVLLQAGTAGAVGGISLTKFAPLAGEEFTVLLGDHTGAIFATSAAGGAVYGAGGTVVTLTGTLDAVNAELAGLRISDGANDTLYLLAGDSDGGTASASLALDVNVPASISAPAQILAFGGSPVGNLNISLSDPYAAALGETLAVTVSDFTGTLNGQGQSLSFSGTVAEINADLRGLTYLAPPDQSSPDFIDIEAIDPSGGAGSAAIVVTPPGPPTLTAPSLVAIGPALVSPIDGLSVQGGDNEPADTPITIALFATAGVFGVTEMAGVAVSGDDTNKLELVGLAGALDTALASLVYLGGTETASGEVDGEPQVDEIAVLGIEGGVTTGSLIAVSAPTLSGSTVLARPVLVLATDEDPTSAALLQWDQGDAGYVGTLYVDLPGYYGAAPQTPPLSLALTGFDSTIPVPIISGYYGAGPDEMTSYGTQEPYAPVVGDWVSEYGEATAISLGDVGEGSPVQFSISSTDVAAKQPDTITYIIGSSSGSTLLPDRRLTVVFNKPGGTTVQSSSSSSSSSNGGGGGGGGKGGGGSGDVHLTTFDGLHYDFQASGEFVLAKSTAPGDSYQIQIRLQPWHNSASVSVMTEVAAAVGSDRVTFGLDRADVVWVNGAAVSLGNNQRIDLADGTLEQLTATSWEILWDSGETLTVSDAGSYLNIATTLARNAAAGSVEGLLGNDNGNPANDLVLPDGTVLQQPVSFAQLYTSFANAWRVTQATSLLDYGPGESTASFTDLSFPSDAVSLADVPANIYENAVSLVTAAGITSPALQQSAIEDYLLTGDSSFVASDAQQTQTVAAVLQSPPNPVEIAGFGIGANETSLFQSNTGTTAVTFTVYNSGTSAAADVLDYAVVLPQGGALSAVSPSGTVTLAAGQASTQLTVAVTGTLGAAGDESLSVEISAARPGELILAPGAVVDVLNATPVRGTDAQVQFSDLSAIGTMTGDTVSGFTLDLGTLALDQVLGSIEIGLANGAGSGADTLSGLFGLLGSGPFSFAGGLAPVAGLGSGAMTPLVLDIDTGTLGSFAEVLSFTADEYNASGYSGGLGTYFLTIEAEIGAAPLIHAPAQDAAAAGQTATLGGVSLSVPEAAFADAALSVTLSDMSGTLAIGTPGAATLSGSGTALTLTGGLDAVNAALAALEFTGTQNDLVTIDAGFIGGGAVSVRTLAVAAAAPGIAAADFIAAAGSPVAVAGFSIEDAFAAQTGGIVTLAITAGSGVLAAAGSGIIGEGSSSLVLSGTVLQVNQELSTLDYTRLAGGFAPDPLSLALLDGAGESASATIEAEAPTLSIITPGDIISAIGTAVPLAGVTLADPAAGPDGAVSVTLASRSGVFVAPAADTGGLTIAGAGTDELVLSGSLAAVNAGLAALQYEETLASGTIAVTAADAGGNLAGAAITANDIYVTNIETLPTQLGPQTSLQALADIVLGEIETSPLVYEDEQSGSGFSESEFFAGLGEGEAILRDSAEGQAVDAATWLTFLDNVFDAAGLIYTSGELSEMASTLAAISQIIASPSAGAAPVTADNAPLAAASGGALANLAAALGDLISNPASAGNLSNLLGADNTITQSVTSGNMGGLFGGLVDAALFAGGVAGSVGAGTASGIGGALSSAWTLYKDYNDPNITSAQLQQDLINFDVGMAGLALNVAAAASLISPTTYAVLAGALIGYGIYQTFFNNNNNGNSTGDVHLTTFSDQLYNFQAEGEFTLAQSTVTGDSFDIQVRLQPWYDSASVSVMTQIGAAVGSDRVTFGIGRSSTVYIDGTPSSISQGNPFVQLDGGFLVQVSANQYAVIWNTGEAALISDDGTYLAVSVSLGPNAQPNSVQGLLGPDNGAANDFTLPDGTVLSQPLSASELYTTFADAWRITDAASLLDYGTGQNTASFTDVNFPGDAIALSSVPAEVLAQAASLVAAAGITNPAAAEAAELDYIATGSTNFIAEDASLTPEIGLEAGIAAASVTTASAVVSAGIFAPEPSIAAAAAGSTAVPFEIYLTGTLATDEVIDYSVFAPDSAELGLVAFGGALPSGAVTIAAGQSTAFVTIDVGAGVLGSLAGALLEVSISAADAAPVFAATAETTLVNSTPEPGPAAVPELLNLSGTGMLTPYGTGYLLDLGTLIAGASLGAVQIELANAATYGADLLAGAFGSAAGSGFVLSPDAFGSIAAGASVSALSVTALTGTLGRHQEVILLYPTDSNATGYETTLTPLALTIEDDVVNPAAPFIAQGTVIDFGTIHAGDTVLEALTIANTAQAPAGGLDVAIASLSGSALGSGQISMLGAGAGDTTDVTLGLAAGLAGTVSGTATLDLASDTGNLSGTEVLPAATLDLSATVLNYATAALAVLSGGSFTAAANGGTLDLGTLLPGAGAVVDLAVLNEAAGPADLLSGSFVMAGAPGFTDSGFAAFSSIGAGGSLTGLEVTLNADVPGLLAQTITLDAAGYDAGGYSGTLAPQVLVIEAQSAECFVKGTMIATPRGRKAVEKLKIGDTVKTPNGAKKIKWIGRRGYDGRFVAGQHLMLPVCLRRGAIARQVPSRDLWVSPGHGIWLEGALVPAWRLVNGVSVIQAEAVERVEYFHIEIESHEILLAENCPAESFYNETGRGAFQNAGEYAALYGEEAEIPPLPRRESGAELEALRRRLAARAGIAEAALPCGTLRGFIDELGPERLCGWAQDEAAPEQPVWLDILIGDWHLGRVLANVYRADLRAAGMGSGCHGFSLPLPAGVRAAIEIRRAADGAVLPPTEAALCRAA